MDVHTGRYAIVVAADIAVYASGPARPTGGAGAIALLVGADAPIVVEPQFRSVCSKNVWDFYKADMASEYPRVDGQLSIQCYLSALASCYCRVSEKLAESQSLRPSLELFDYFICHAPYCKLVNKSIGLLHYIDYLRGGYDVVGMPSASQVAANFVSSREVRDLYTEQSRESFSRKTSASLSIARDVGNMYTASVFGSLLALLSGEPASALIDRRVGVYSYGSGFVASLFCCRFRGAGSRLEQLTRRLALQRQRFATERIKCSPKEFADTLAIRESRYTSRGDAFTPSGSLETLSPGTWYLRLVDEQARRHYAVLGGNGSKISESFVSPLSSAGGRKPECTPL